MSAVMKIIPRPKTIKEIAAILSEGDKVREVCPFCNGGSTHERSLQMTRKGTVAVYICYRASCGVRGKYTYGGVTSYSRGVNSSSRVPPIPADRYSGEFFRLPVKYSQYFSSTYGIQPALLHEYGVKKTDDGRVLFPVLRPDMSERGHNVRAYPDIDKDITVRTTPKAILYIPITELALSWHRLSLVEDGPNNWVRHGLSIPTFHSTTLVLVEDQVSAIKASRLVDCVSLMGTNLSLGKMNEIAREVNKSKYYDKVLILLDADAYRQSIKHLSRTRAILTGVGVRRLERDIKDMTFTEINELLREDEV